MCLTWYRSVVPLWVSDADDSRGHADDDRVDVADSLAGDGRADAAVDAG